ncbi:hypothetical protein BCR43DRAFT_566850 [Syncephalastrum racemosum]|uniref:C2H2-type domain-containing protein n=1 Tax=Syncephalastrum racemosum TaxID=13706 RepID=A0A1X2H1V1_SYNRA|nr:hypothetical protein BCR43DRAFT_566850 [Syncephalastrum racemosum]
MSSAATTSRNTRMIKSNKKEKKVLRPKPKPKPKPSKLQQAEEKYVDTESMSSSDTESETPSTPATPSDTRQRRQRLTQSERLANQLPSGFLRNETNPMRYFFVGFYARSGVHVSRHPGFRIGLKTSAFVSLHKLLHRCGVPSPVFKFATIDSTSTRYKAGQLAQVLWGYRNEEENSTIIVDFGFPSVKTHRSDVELLETFLPHHKRRNAFFLAFLLGYTMANGHINYRFETSTPDGMSIVYKGLQFSSPDLGFLNWIYKELNSLGCDKLQLRKRGGITPASQKAETEHVQYYLIIYNTPANRDVLAYGLVYLERKRIPLDGKLQMLKDFLQAPESTLPGTAASQRKESFHAYISQVRDDPVACVVAQDLYELDLYNLNVILTAVGFCKNPLKSIHDFDLGAFITFIKGLDGEPRNTFQKLLLQYYRSCGTRPADHANIRDYAHKEVSQESRCPQCDKSFASVYNMRRHMLSFHDQGEPLSCRFCDKKFHKLYQRKKHYDTDHRAEREAEQSALSCREEGCEGVTFTKKADLNSHKLICHTAVDTRTFVECPFEDCTSTFRTRTESNKHQHEKHGGLYKPPLGPPVICQIEGCGRSYKYKRSYKAHLKNKHPGISI